MGDLDRQRMRERVKTIGLQKHASCQSGLKVPGKSVNQTEAVLNEVASTLKKEIKLNTNNKYPGEDKLNKKTNSDLAVRKVKTLSTVKATERRIPVNQNKIVLENVDSNSIAILKERLESENLRRIQCEGVIEKLQAMILELHEKVALAIEVDKAKDQEILKYHEVWQEASNKVSKLIVENEQLQTNFDKASNTVEKAKKKIYHYKQEAVKAMSMYQNITDRVNELDHLNEEVINRLQNKEEKFAELAYRYMEEVEKNKELKEAMLRNKFRIKENNLYSS